MANWPYWIASLAFLSPLLGWLANRRYHQMKQISQLETAVAPTLPSISIIIPARNEEENLQRLLPSLKQLDYNGQVEILVVDDHSADETAVVANAQGVKSLSLDKLPSGWLGKPNACHQGAAVTQSDWLLFTDADTEHTPHGLTEVMSHALNNNLDGLSCHLQHRTNFILDSLALTAAFAALFAGLPRNDLSLNGQYILLRREVYEKSGGFSAVRQEPLEDLAFGHHLYKQGYHVPMYRGEQIAAVAMYHTVGQLWRGMTRLGAGALRWSGAGNSLTVLFITAVMTPLLVSLLIVSEHLPPIWLPLTWAAATLGMVPWAKRFGPLWFVALAPIGALFVQSSAMWGLAKRLCGQSIIWKGRAV